jgi:hypothetical protein
MEIASIGHQGDTNETFNETFDDARRRLAQSKRESPAALVRYVRRAKSVIGSDGRRA